MKRNLKPQESIADFKLRLSALMRGQHEPIIGAARSHPCVVRGKRDRGYKATPTTP